MRCPHCDRPQSLSRFRCGACRTRLPAWYVRTLLVLAVFIGLAMILIDVLVNLGGNKP
ncbi:MAG TPA: hypothetical protein VF507_07920 [Pyrinomonadaceae bacterium]